MISRRKFLKRSSEAGVAIAATSAGLGATIPEPVDPYTAVKTGPPGAGLRAQRSFEIRCDSAHADACRENPSFATNADEERYADKRANFAKTLPHDELGEVKLDSYAAWISILVGDLIGPYISQFLWLDIPYGIKTIDQRYRSPGPTSISLPILPPGWPANEAPSPPPSSSSTRRRGTSAGAVKLSNMCMRILAFKPM